MPDGPIPYGRGVDVASSVEMDTGESLRFSVPRTHLDPGLSIKIDFQFGWEQNNHNTRHSSYFSYWDLPNTLRNKEKEKKLKCVSGLCLPELKTMPPPKPTELPEPPPVVSAPLTIPDLPAIFLQPPRK
jgi:hypothetical protein